MSKKFLSPIKLAQGASTPSTGSSGELFYNTTDSKIYTHNGSAWIASGGGVTNSATMPSNPSNGDAWFNTNEGTLFVYYSDGTSSQWVEATAPKQGVESYQLPAGSIMAWGGSVAPANWLIADGSAVSRTTYASLFAAIGTTYGSGDGSTTFNLPNLKGRVAVGLDSAQSEFNTLGETGGAKTHTLTVDEMPSHNHTQNPHTHTKTTSTAGSSTTRVAIGSATTTNDAFTTDATTATNNPTGGGQAHNNLQPYIVLNYIIKFSAGETPGDSELATRISNVETVNNATPQGPNYIINGAFDIWQRGTSFSAAGYTADRWNIVAASGQTVAVSQQTFTPGAAPVAGYEGTYYTRVAWSGTPSGYFWYNQKVEDVRTLAGQTVTLSFWAKASTATSALNSTIELNMGSGGSGGVTLNGSALSLTTSWARYSTTFTLPSMSGKTIGTNSYLDVRPLQGGSSVAGINIDVWGVQLEAGAYATPFRRNAPSIQAELAACQRYFVLFSSGTVEIFNPYFSVALSSGSQRIYTQFPVEMRVPPSVLTSAGSALNVFTYYPSNATTNASVNISMGASDTKTMSGSFSNSNNGGNSLAAIYATGVNANSIYVSAEL